MSKQHIGHLPPRYRFLLNPHESLKLSRCSRCNKLTYPRKFALFIHVEDFGQFTLGMTCKYCTRCEYIMCHQTELEAQLAQAFEQLKPQVIGNEYLVIGTVDLKTWKAGLSGQVPSLQDTIAHLPDFKKVDTLDFDPGGWRPKDADPERFMLHHKDAETRLVTPWGSHSSGG